MCRDRTEFTVFMWGEVYVSFVFTSREWALTEIKRIVTRTLLMKLLQKLR